MNQDGRCMIKAPLLAFKNEKALISFEFYLDWNQPGVDANLYSWGPFCEIYSIFVKNTTQTVSKVEIWLLFQTKNLSRKTS